MFIQTENPFGEIMPVPYSPSSLMEITPSSKPSNIWKFILGISIFIGGVFVFFVLKKKNEEAGAANIEFQKVESGLNQNEIV
ncbi:hypothetical protein GCM10011514_09830 [Emticicia aquatilis]|uniref:Uncharacterized protein n=1 Tax=Emticicia aquatilis TaxID=1537369 RepID=A0A916YIW6_9BACT|nr:hypothetical protein [Emticicia aquatilis]GGD47879.1 hypothetical protein GCM10011514_09830 [Emticicia aquatilis]